MSGGVHVQIPQFQRKPEPSYKPLWAIWCGYWEPNLCPMQEQCAACFCQHDRAWTDLGRGNVLLAWGEVFGTLSWSIEWESPAHCEQCHLQAHGPELYKKADWVNLAKKASNGHSSVTSVSLSISRFCPKFLDWLTSMADSNLNINM